MKVLFVCFNNVTRSQAAKAFYNELTNSHDAESAGINVEHHYPDADTMEKYGTRKNAPSAAWQAMSERGLDVADSPRIHLTLEILNGGGYDLVVNLAERDQTPDWLHGDKVIWWDIVDPSKEKDFDKRLAQSRTVLDLVKARVEKLIEVEKAGGDFHELDDNINGE